MIVIESQRCDQGHRIVMSWSHHTESQVTVTLCDRKLADGHEDCGRQDV